MCGSMPARSRLASKRGRCRAMGPGRQRRSPYLNGGLSKGAPTSAGVDRRRGPDRSLFSQLEPHDAPGDCADGRTDEAAGKARIVTVAAVALDFRAEISTAEQSRDGADRAEDLLLERSVATNEWPHQLKSRRRGGLGRYSPPGGLGGRR